MLNRSDGPDFLSAEVEIDGVRYRGDVEIHLHYHDWFNHGHHLDKRYDQVVLHLVWNKDESGERPVPNSKKLAIPTFFIQEIYPMNPGELISSMTDCYLPDTDHDQFRYRLQLLALERLFEKGKRIQNQIMTSGHDQTLYQNLLRMLGSPNNSENFEKLALLLPWPKIQDIRRTLHPGIEIWLALFLYVAGFLDRFEHLKPLWEPVKRISSGYLNSRMPYEVWKVSGQRPWNNPLTRLQGLSHFIHQFGRTSLYQVYRDLFTARTSNEILLNNLFRLLSPKPSVFWQEQIYRPGTDPKGFWGKSRQIEIIGNVLIPHFYQEALLGGSNGFAEYLEDFYLYLPAGESYGRLKSYGQWREIKILRPGGFYIRQALLKMQQEYCRTDGCPACPLGRIPEKKLT